MRSSLRRSPDETRRDAGRRLAASVDPLLVRTAAWFVLLQEQGLINDDLQTLGLIGGLLPLIFNRTGVIIAMTHALSPFIVLQIYSVMITIPKNLMPAAASLGAHSVRRCTRRDVRS
ncbi:hypothetical protein QBK99_00885 [Corticibacterium sp. UT-5YL-CI-8]|nr:hypothetical protein [Tianweitania sp. UT-5YL-CI-8]